MGIFRNRRIRREERREQAENTESIIESYTRKEPRNPEDHPVPAYNCPTGTCGTDKICAEVVVGDPIDSNGRAHIERNACNQCPSSPPVPLYRTIPPHGRNPARQKLLYYQDHTGRQWLPDSRFTAPIFHGDAGLGHREPDSMTFRLDVGLTDDEHGWQCRYYHGVLDDTSTDMGTYDYAKAPSAAHTSMDVRPHNENPNYAPNLTTKY